MTDGVKFAIVVQGPDYGERTFQIAQYLLDNNDARTDIVLSIWDQKDTATRYAALVSRVEGSRVHLVASDEPHFKFNGMHRYSQRESTRRGIEFAISNLGSTHILKMRSDNLIRVPNACAWLLNKQGQYPPVLNREGKPLVPRRERLIVSQTGCVESVQLGNFHVSDHWMFGRAAEMSEWYEDPNGYLNRVPPARHFVECIPLTERVKIPLDPQIFTQEGIDPEADFAQFWLLTSGVGEYVLNTRDLLSRYFILLSNTDVDLVHKFFPLDASKHHVLKPFWTRYAHPNDPTTVSWFEWIKEHWYEWMKEHCKES